MTLARFLFRTLLFHRRNGIMVAAGVAVATAMIVGSLVVGDSVTGSVRETILDRLGTIDYGIIPPHPVRPELARDIDHALPDGARAVGITMARGAVRNASDDTTIPNVTVLGVDEHFESLFPEASFPELAGRNAAMNAALAADLNLDAGGTAIVHVGRASAAPGDTLFGRRDRDDTLGMMRLTIDTIVDDTGPGAFGLDAQTFIPRNIFVSVDWLRRALDRSGLGTAILITGSDDHQALHRAVKAAASLEDRGYDILPKTNGATIVVRSSALLFNAEQESAVREAAAEIGANAGGVSVYLADTIAIPDRNVSISYATLAGVEGLDSITLLAGDADSIDASEIVLNEWAADDLGVTVGEMLDVAYLVPQRDGTYATRTIQMQLRGIAAMQGLAADSTLVPEFEGITEAETVSDWNPPFPVDLGRVTQRDEDYWEKYRAAPRGFIAMETIRRMWSDSTHGGRSEWLTSFRVTKPSGGNFSNDDVAAFSTALRAAHPIDVAGLAPRPLRRQALAAAQGSQDFGMLFTAMSSFVIAAALGLSAMLLRLGTQRRAREAGMLQAFGFTNRTVGRLLFAEGVILTVIGTLAGVLLGIAYGAAMIHALSSGVLGTIGSAQLALHLNAGKIALGGVAGIAAGCFAAALGVRSLSRAGVIPLLSGWSSISATKPVSGKRSAVVLVVSMITAVLMLIMGNAQTVSPSIAFFVAGAALLTACLLGCHLLLGAAGRVRFKRFTQLRFIIRTLSANRSRTLLTLGLFASAAFVLVAVAANHRNYGEADVTDAASGTGGFALRGVSAVPIHFDFNSPAGRERLGFDSQADEAFAAADVRAFGFLSTTGDDISCLNLAAATAPRVLGVSDDFIQRGGFTVRLADRSFDDAPWQALNADYDEAIPVFGDSDSIMWQLNARLGDVIESYDEAGRPLRLRVAGMISGSIFAGELLMSQQNFRAAFPSETAPRYFLLSMEAGAEAEIASLLRRTLGDMGVEVTDTRDILNAVIAVQNTYLATFLALGGLGLLLGAVGLVVVMLRTAFERYGEFALMSATGFPAAYPSKLLIAEHVGLLPVALVIGTGCALLAVAPVLAQAETSPKWPLLTGILLACATVGIVAGALAARSVVGANILQTLREEG